MSIAFTIRQLEYFEAVAAEGSLTAAARRCRVTPSALTLALDELERHLNVQLLVRRKGRGVTLTPTGTRMLTHARSVLRRVELLGDEASRVTTALSGRYQVGCFVTLSPFFAPAVVGEFQRAYPDVDLTFIAATAAELQDQLLQGRLDVALMYSADVADNVAFEPLLQYRPHVLVAADHPLAQRSAISLAELIAAPLVVLDVPPTAENTRGIFDRLDLRPTIGATSTSFEAVRCMVGRGLGYAVMFQRPAATVTYDGHEVRTLELTDPVPPAVVGLARARGAVPTARDDALKAVLVRARATE